MQYTAFGLGQLRIHKLLAIPQVIRKHSQKDKVLTVSLFMRIFVTIVVVIIVIVTNVLAQYSEWTVGSLSSVTCAPMFMQFTGCHQLIQGFYWPENAIDWLRKC